MRIFVLSIVNLRVCDAQRVHLLEKWSRIAAQGNDVHLWVYDRDPVIERLAGANLTIHRAPHLSIRYLMDLSYQLSMLTSVILQTFKGRPDTVYVRNSALDFASILAALFCRCPLVVELPGPILEEGARYGFSPLKYQLATWLMRSKMRLAARIITVTEPIKQGLVGTYGMEPDKIAVIQNAANTELFRPLPRVEAQAAVGLDSGKRYVGFVGNLSPWHGVEILIEAAKRVFSVDSSIAFLIVGDGIMRESLEKRVIQEGLKDNIIFTGAVPYQQVPRYVACCHLMTLPLINKMDRDSGYSPLKLYEYLACGRPVISSRLTGLEVVEDENVGRLVTANMPEELAEAICSLLLDEARLAEMGENGRRVAVEKFDWSVVARKTAGHLANLTR